MEPEKDCYTELKRREHVMRVWQCRIVVDDDQELPDGFDFPPRRAAINAVLEHGVEVVSCFSGWGNQTTLEEEYVIERKRDRTSG